MFKKINWRTTIRTAVFAALLFCIPVFVYIQYGNYTGSWLLYLGSFLFMAVLWMHTLAENKRRRANESTIALVFASHVTTVLGILISCAISFILLVILVPGYLGPGVAEKTLTGEPPQLVVDKTDGLSFEVFMAAIVMNFSVGSFTSIILPFYAKQNQTRDRRRPTPLHQQGTQ
jgi:NAD/NADP transhydrogenase beta subunit